MNKDHIASIFAIIVIGSFLSFPWLLSIQETKLERTIDLPELMVKKLPSDCESLIMYVGYPGCQTECPLALGKLAYLLEHKDINLKVNPKANLKVCTVFFSLFANQQKMTERYAKRYHHKIIGLSLSEDEKNSFLNILGNDLRLSRQGTHTDYIYQFIRQGKDWILSGRSLAQYYEGKAP